MPVAVPLPVAVRVAVAVAVAVLALNGAGCTAGPPPEPAADCDPDLHDDAVRKVLPSHASARPFDAWSLWSSGETQLRGANLYQRRSYPEWDEGANGEGVVGPPVEPADLEALRDLDANLVILSHPGLFSEQAPHVHCAAIEDHLTGLLDQLQAADLFAVIAFRSGPGRSEFDLIGPRDWANEGLGLDAEAHAAWTAMWQYTAARYRNHPAVVGYLPLVEPNTNEQVAAAYEPDTFYEDEAGTEADWNPLAQAIVGAIRSQDAETPVLVQPLNYADIYWLDALDPGPDERLVLAFNQYEPYAFTHQEGAVACACGPASGGRGPCTDEDLDLHLALADDAARGRPIAVPEYGGNRWVPGLPDFLDAELTQLEALGANHAVWEWGSEFGDKRFEDGFNVRHGTRRRDHEVVEIDDNPLLETLSDWWQRNDAWPSTFGVGEAR